jgi:uncharacterized protein
MSTSWVTHLVLPLVLVACAAPKPATKAAERVEKPLASRDDLVWEPFAPETFARAKRERKLIVMDGSAEWCHWCHVMDATTYHDPRVRDVIAKSFIAVKVDVDARPDLQERYSDYGWPATVLFSPDAEEIGKYRGYIAPDDFATILRDVARGAGAAEAGADPGRTASYVTGVSRRLPKSALAEEQVAWIARATELELEDHYDPIEGGWGRTQKAPLGWNNAWLLGRAAAGDAKAKEKVLTTLEKQSKLIDPVWGGIYQYSAASDWDHPHFEKLMTFQAPALENYAEAYRLTGDPKHLARARAMLGYIDRFMRSPGGGFYATQDADLSARVDGHAYYALPEKERLAHGVPRIDTNEYGKENGLAIGAYVAMARAADDPAVLASAARAASHMLTTRGARGGIAHRADQTKVLYLADNAAFGWGLARLYEATRDDRWLTAARSIAELLLTELLDEDSGGLFASTKDPDAVGVFATRRIPFEENVMALRFLARLPKSAKYSAAIGRILRAISTPDEIKARGRMLGDYLLALEETKLVR